MDQVIVRRNQRQQDTGEVRKRYCRGCDFSSLNHQEQRPSEKKAKRSSVRLAQKNVNAAGSRHHRGQFRAAERAGDRHHPRDDPREQEPAGRTAQPGRFRGRNENARTDHRADDDHRGVQ